MGQTKLPALLHFAKLIENQMVIQEVDVPECQSIIHVGQLDTAEHLVLTQSTARRYEPKHIVQGLLGRQGHFACWEASSLG